MAKFQVSIDEIVTYTVEVDARTEEQAERRAEAVLRDCENVDKYLTDVHAHEVSFVLKVAS